MAHIHKKMKKGRPYYYVREIARVNGKPTVVNQVYLGSPERILRMVTTPASGIQAIQCQEFGALWLAHLVEKDIGIAEIVDSVIPASGDLKVYCSWRFENAEIASHFLQKSIPYKFSSSSSSAPFPSICGAFQGVRLGIHESLLKGSSNICA